MKTFIETERLLLREIVATDEAGLFALDSDPEVHRYLGNEPLQDIAQVMPVINFIRQQYIDNGVGRWAVVEKSSINFIGWCGFKLIRDTINNHSNFFDIGYRFIKNYWGKGYATEAAAACLTYGFTTMDLQDIYGMADCSNNGSHNVLTKIGLRCIEPFDYDGTQHNWYHITKKDWLTLSKV